jgi:dihydrolipoamide dehydrogenase
MSILNQPTDVAIVGGGPGGYVAALSAAQRGARVILVEKENIDAAPARRVVIGGGVIGLEFACIYEALGTCSHFRPVIRVVADGDKPEVVETRVRRAMQSAQKYSFVANSVKSEIVIDPKIVIEE